MLASLVLLLALLPAAPDTVTVDTTRAAVVMDDADARSVWITAYWAPLPAEETPAAHAGRALHDGGAADDGEVRFRVPDSLAGRYAVALYWPRLRDGHDALATNAKVFVRHTGGRTDLRVDLRGGGDAWHPLGVYAFDGDGYVEVINNGADGVVVVDAVRFVPVR